jgi:hypothetical protein
VCYSRRPKGERGQQAKTPVARKSIIHTSHDTTDKLFTMHQSSSNPLSQNTYKTLKQTSISLNEGDRNLTLDPHEVRSPIKEAATCSRSRPIIQQRERFRT